ncbi:hypothetical protein BDW_10145 [Bdellovibrio bacteriovorus W]|nr:hypothetical protein BDW_10145 [Bdellovibrio bacteriovorus W]
MAKLCTVDIPEVQGLKGGELTVGREFFLHCETEFPHQLDSEKLNFVLKPEENHQIKLLSFELRSPTSADLKVTSYRTGESNFKELMLSDGEKSVNLGEVQFAVRSVLPPQEAPIPGMEQAAQQPQPYPAMGPVGISVPVFYWIILAAVIVLFVGAIAYRLIRRLQRKNLIESLRSHDAALSPIAQFHQNSRKLQRANTVFFGGASDQNNITEAVTETEKHLKLFLTRQYQTPALEWGEKAVLRDLKTHHKALYLEFHKELGSLFEEYLKAKKDFAKVTESDAQQIVKRTRQLVEKMEAMQ